MLPLIFQHVRELAEAHSGLERDRYKIITPFPPTGSDCPDFPKEALEFNDPPAEGDSATLDTVRAFDFFRNTDNLYYDYSYGIKSDDYLLSEVCRRFFLNAKADESDIDFWTTFKEKSDAFQRRYLRSTVGDLGHFDYRYTSLTTMSWNKVVLNADDTARLQAKAVAVYEDLEDTGFVKSLIEQVKAGNYSRIEYELGYFDVIREWMDPHLFEGPWQFSSGDRVLYGERDAFLAENPDVKLCFPQRFYLVRNCLPTGTSPPPPDVRDHRSEVLAAVRPLHLAGAVAGTAVTGASDRRRVLRNALIEHKLAKLAVTPVVVHAVGVAATPPPRAGFVWVPASAGVPGHWERERAGAPPPVPEPAYQSVYKVAAIRGRVLPREP